MTTTSYSKAAPGKFGCCIDWETSGANFEGLSHIDYQGIAFGAVIFDMETYQPVETLYRELQFDDTKYQWTDSAEAIHGLSREHLAEHGVTREEALIDLLELIAKWIGPTSKICLMGHNCDFDRDFTLQLARDFGIELTFHHVRIDTSCIGMATVGLYKSDALFNLFCGLERGKHNALEDALATLQVVRTVREVFQEALGV